MKAASHFDLTSIIGKCPGHHGVARSALADPSGHQLTLETRRGKEVLCSGPVPRPLPAVPWRCGEGPLFPLVERGAKMSTS